MRLVKRRFSLCGRRGVGSNALDLALGAFKE